MKNSAHAHSALTQNRQFRTHIARKEYAHFNEVGRGINFNQKLEWFLTLKFSSVEAKWKKKFSQIFLYYFVVVWKIIFKWFINFSGNFFSFL